MSLNDTIGADTAHCTTVPATASVAPVSFSLAAERLGLFDGPELADRGRWFREGDNVTALHARSRGAATRLVGLAWADAYQAVLALPGAGIAEPAQLAGRRLGLPQHDERLAIDVRRAAASRGFHSATALSCLFCDEYQYVDLELDDEVADDEPAAPYAAEAAALLRGEVDAIYVSGDAGRALARRIGAVEVVGLGAHLDPMVRVNAMTPIALTADEHTLQREPERVARLLAALLRARALGTGGVAQQRPLPSLDLSIQALAALSAQKDWLRTHGFLAADVDLAAWVDAAPLAAAHALV